MKKVSISQPTFQRNHTVKSISFGLPQNRRTLTQPLTWRSHGWCIYKDMAGALHSSTWHRTRCGFAPSREPTNPAPGSQHHRHFAKSCLSFERDTLKNLTNMKKICKMHLLMPRIDISWPSLRLPGPANGGQADTVALQDLELSS